MIKSFRDKRTAAVFIGKLIKGLPPDVVRRAHLKLMAIDSAVRLSDLSVPPANRLEALARDRRGQHSIRVNDQWRICFVWSDGHAEKVEFCDYH